MRNVKKLLAILILIAPLCGCVPIALVVGATAGGALLYNQRSFKVMLQDQNAVSRAQRVIDKDPTLKGKTHISVAVYNHICLMVGQADSPALRDRAYELVAQVPNISRIYNEVTISGPTSLIQRSNDTWITSKVKAAMLAERGLKSTEIKVITEDSVVYLMGLVSPQQAALATNIARRIRGVSKVVKVFQYT